MKKHVRILSLVLCMVMLLGIAPLQALAGYEINSIEIVSLTEPSEYNYPRYGYGISVYCDPCTDYDDAYCKNGVQWADVTDGYREILPNEAFVSGHIYQVDMFVVPAEGYSWNTSISNFTLIINGEAVDAQYHMATLGNAKRIYYTFPVVPHVKHNWEDHVIEPGELTKSGIMFQRCTVCGEETAVQAIPEIAGAEIDEYHARYGFAYNGKNHFPNVFVDDEEGNVLAQGKDYIVTYPSSDKKMGTYKLTVNYIGRYSGKQTLTYRVVLGKPSVRAKSTADSVTLSWDKVYGAAGYRVYGYNIKTGQYTKLADTTKLSYKRTGRKPGTEYAYLVRAYYKDSNGKLVLSEYNKNFNNVYIYTLCKAPSVKASVSGKTVTLKWAKCAGAQFYRVYEYNAKTKKYTTLVKQTKSLSAKLTKRTKGTHYYLVRAFNNGDVGSAYSTKNHVKVVVK